MNKFIEVPASKISLARRKPVCGVGINDADYMVQKKSPWSVCPYYQVWIDMIKRCYSKREQSRYPTYTGCSVAKEWLTFSSFRSWMEDQDWQGKAIDKDILISGNKIYSAETCLFVSSAINNLMLGRAASRGEQPQGVCFHKKTGRYQAQCKVNGKSKHLGCFKTPREAELAYLEFKSGVILSASGDEEAVSNPKLQSALLRHASATSSNQAFTFKQGEI